ncbi:P-loop containing nucleoside triphosphate hydrolase protein [Clavulina sp. PMI_390]|nr:P-loop containing nucleoside triphosphate hydrolase protein [Clavulina sp. PMI_390]
MRRALASVAASSSSSAIIRRPIVTVAHTGSRTGTASISTSSLAAQRSRHTRSYDNTAPKTDASSSTSGLGSDRSEDDALNNSADRDHNSPPGNQWDGFVLSSPRQLVQYLDSYIVGQERAKKVLSVAVFNHYNRIKAKHAQQQSLDDQDDPTSLSSFASSWDDPSRPSDNLNLRPHPDRRPPPPHHRRPSSSSSSSAAPFGTHPRRPPLLNSPLTPTVFEKSNVLLMGPTGSGKTLLARTLAKVLDVPFAMSDATTLTQAGYVGEDVEMIIHRLLQASAWDPHRASFGIVVVDEADKLARRSTGGGGGGGGADGGARDVGGEGVQQGLLRMLEGSVVSVNARGVEGSGGGDDIRTILTLTLHTRRGVRVAVRMGTAKSEVYQVDTTDILFILSGAFVGLDKVVQQRMNKGSIGFGAPLASDGFGLSSITNSKDRKAADHALPFFTKNSQPKDVNPYDLVEPVDLIRYGFIPEFTSRLPTITALKPLSIDDLMRVLTDVRGALAKQYEALFSYSGVEIRFTTRGLRAVCEIALERGMGARGLRGVMEGALLEAMYDVPGSSVRYVLVDHEVVQGLKPAMYFSRGEGGAFYSALAAAEEEVFGPSSSSSSSAAKTVTTGEDEGKLRGAEEEDEELRREVAAREDERNRKVDARGGEGGGFP